MNAAKVTTMRLDEHQIESLGDAYVQHYGLRPQPPVLTRASLESFEGRSLSDAEWTDAADRAERSGEWTVER